MPHICVDELGQHCFIQWLVAYSAPTHYLNQFWVIVNWILRKKLLWNLNQSTNVSFTKMHLVISSAKWRTYFPRGDDLTLRVNHAVRYSRVQIQYIWNTDTLRPRQNGCHFPDDIFKCIFLNESIWISIEISLKFVPKGPISNIPALGKIMAWRRPGDKPLSEPMLVCLLTASIS